MVISSANQAGHAQKPPLMRVYITKVMTGDFNSPTWQNINMVSYYWRVHVTLVPGATYTFIADVPHCPKV